MPSSTFLSRYDKDIELGAAIKSQVDAGIPKGTLRAISSEWLNEYLGYIEKVLSAGTDSARMVRQFIGHFVVKRGHISKFRGFCFVQEVKRPGPILNFDLL